MSREAKNVVPHNEIQRWSVNGGTSDTDLQTIVFLVKSGEMDAAARAAASLQDKDIAASAWRQIARGNADLQRFEPALRALETALHFQPESPDLRLERAAILESSGDMDGALAELRWLGANGFASPSLSAHLGRSLEFAGRVDEAEASVESALERWPTDAGLHRLLAELRWSRGAHASLTERLESAIRNHPQDLKLRLVAADVLRNAGFDTRALHLLEEGLRRAPGSSAFLTSIGVLLDSLGRLDDALAYLQAAVERAPDSIPARRNLIPTLLRLGRPQQALALCEGLLVQSPDDQQLNAWRATSLRAMAHEDYAWLHDYPRLVRSYRLRSDHAGGIAGFNAEFALELTALHSREQRPLSQSLRGGSQTDRNLPAHRPIIAQFFAMLDAPIRDYIERLAPLDASHPTARRAPSDGAFRISGSWSVRLGPSGFHVNHVHPAGWLSSAYYVQLPPLNEGSREGWLAFGEPGIAIPGMHADHHVMPEAGMLVLFPSFMWHGTVPFTEGSRLTAAFDVVPR